MFSGIFDIISLLINTQKFILSYQENNFVLPNTANDDFEVRQSSHGNPYLNIMDGNSKSTIPRGSIPTTTIIPKTPAIITGVNTTKLKITVNETVDSISSTAGQPCVSGECPSGYKCMLDHCTVDVRCPAALTFGDGPPKDCSQNSPIDPNNKPPTELEKWFTKEIFDDLFPKANIGWGMNKCWPYSYEAFVIATRYFPRFGTEAPKNGYSAKANYRRDLATFFAHAVQETGENDASLYATYAGDLEKAAACFYRGGFYNWFEGGPTSSFLQRDSPGYQPIDGEQCFFNGRYCPVMDVVNTYFYPCNNGTTELPDGASQKPTKFYKGCYFGRGAIQISYNFNYKQFQDWLQTQNIKVDLLKNPNLVMTKMDPPLSMMASLWFYMTPQPPKPAMHDIIMGNWNAGPVNEAANYMGPMLGPTSLVINNECNGEDEGEPGGPGESRRIKGFKWFCKYFGVEVGPEESLTCKHMPQQLGEIKHSVTWQPNWTTSWKNVPCSCAPAPYGGSIPYFQPEFYPNVFVKENEKNEAYCVFTIYDKPELYGMDNSTSACLGQPMPKEKIRGYLKDLDFSTIP